MAATVQVNRSIAGPGDLRYGVECTIQGDSSYVTGGYAVTPAQFGLTKITGIVAEGASGNVIASYNGPAGKVLFIAQATGAEVANASDRSAAFLPVIVYGT